MFNEFWQDGPRFLAGDAFPIGTDAVMLYAFCKDLHAKRILDLGAGSGVIGQMLAFGDKTVSVTGLEIQPASVRESIENAKANDLALQYTAICADINSYRECLTAGSFDLCVSNPPYYPHGSGKTSVDDKTKTARSESSCTLSDICKAASYAVRWGGKFCMVHKPERLAEILYTMHENGLEPKRLRFVRHTVTSAPSIVLIQSVRGAKAGLVLEDDLILTENGHDSREACSIYHRKYYGED